MEELFNFTKRVKSRLGAQKAEPKPTIVLMDAHMDQSFGAKRPHDVQALMAQDTLEKAL